MLWKLAADPVAFKPVISKARKESGLKDLVFAGDRGIITKTRIAELRSMRGAGWVTALRAPDITALAANDGPLHLSCSMTRTAPCGKHLQRVEEAANSLSG
jgi:hypothetical protein